MTTDDVKKEAELMNFEDARMATEAMMEEPQEIQPAEENDQTVVDEAEETNETNETNEENQSAEEPSEMQYDSDVQAEASQEQTEQAIQTAETAAQAAIHQNQETQILLQQMQELSQQNAKMQELISQMNEQQKEAVVEEAMEEPVLDIASLAFDDEETIRQKQSKYAADMARYMESRVLEKVQPYIDQAEEARMEKEKAQVLDALSQVPELSGIREMAPHLERIIKSNKALSGKDIPIDEKYITAYAIAKGADAINAPASEAPKEPTAQELFQMYQNNPELQELIEKDRLSKVKPSQQVPVFSASSGAVNAALNIKETPKTFDEAYRRTVEDFRG